MTHFTRDATHLVVVIFYCDLGLIVALLFLLDRVTLLFPPVNLTFDETTDLFLYCLIDFDLFQTGYLALTRRTDKVIVQQVIVNAFFTVKRLAAGSSARGM